METLSDQSIHPTVIKDTSFVQANAMNILQGFSFISDMHNHSFPGVDFSIFFRNLAYWFGQKVNV